MTVTVSQSHFKSSVGYSSNDECPLALAIKSVMPENTFVYVGGFDIVIDANTYDIGKEWENPIKINQFIEDAQQGLDIDTVTVTLTKIN